MEHIEKLLIEIKESLERQLQEGFDGINVRFGTQAIRLDQQIAELTRRIEKLEGIRGQ